jgi:hypothetical protein
MAMSGLGPDVEVLQMSAGQESNEEDMSYIAKIIKRLVQLSFLFTEMLHLRVVTPFELRPVERGDSVGRLAVFIRGTFIISRVLLFEFNVTPFASGGGCGIFG